MIVTTKLTHVKGDEHGEKLILSNHASIKQENVELIQIPTKSHVCKGQLLPYCQCHLENVVDALVTQVGNKNKKHHHFPTTGKSYYYMSFSPFTYRYNDTYVSKSSFFEAQQSSFFS